MIVVEVVPAIDIVAMIAIDVTETEMIGTDDIAVRRCVARLAISKGAREDLQSRDFLPASSVAILRFSFQHNS